MTNNNYQPIIFPTFEFIKNNLPLYEEQKQLIEEEQFNVQQILSQFQQPIPSNFIKLELEEEGNYCGSTNLKWNNKPLSERYIFTYEEKQIQIDIPHTILEKLGLEKGEDITQPLYLDPKVLIRPETYRGITIENEEEIFLQQPFTINNLEQNLTKLFQQIEELEEKKELNQQTITDLKQEMEENKKLKSIWLNKYLEEKESNGCQFQTQITNLTTERNNIQRELTNQQTEITNLQTELTQLNNNLQTTQQARYQVQQSLKRNLISSLLKSKQKVKRINELNNSLSFLRGLLFNNNQEVTNLINEQNNLQTQINGLNQQLTVANTLITNKDNEITDLKKRIEDLEAERDALPSITLQELNNLQQELEKEKSWWDKWDRFHAKDFELWFMTDFPLFSLNFDEKRSNFSWYSKVFSNKPGHVESAFFLNEEVKEENYRELRLQIKKIYEYYKKQ